MNKNQTAVAQLTSSLASFNWCLSVTVCVVVTVLGVLAGTPPLAVLAVGGALILGLVIPFLVRSV